ncbi:cuticle protein 12.5-like [Musca vetustissima]|uniref:cuticle protein 12.5-like n=1 Tax=Musca vetustissima TaxID=27455 RepID=UPI002AB79C30|nr:cuticle protein 12.5-like [Musca vetustissima]
MAAKFVILAVLALCASAQAGVTTFASSYNAHSINHAVAYPAATPATPTLAAPAVAPAAPAAKVEYTAPAVAAPVNPVPVPAKVGFAAGATLPYGSPFVGQTFAAPAVAPFTQFAGPANVYPAAAAPVPATLPFAAPGKFAFPAQPAALPVFNYAYPPTAFAAPGKFAFSAPAPAPVYGAAYGVPAAKLPNPYFA